MGLNVPAKSIDSGQPTQSVPADLAQTCLLSVNFLHVKAPHSLIIHLAIKTKSRKGKAKACITFMSN